MIYNKPYITELQELIENTAEITLNTLDVLPGKQSKQQFVELALTGFAHRVKKLVEKHVDLQEV